MDADFHPRESLDIARALHGTESIARSESARHIAATVKASYGPLLQDFRSIASRFDAATFIAAPSSSIAPANIADQWVGVTVPTNDISNVPVSIRLPATTAVLCLWLSLLEDIAAGQKTPAELLAKDDALKFWLDWTQRYAAGNLALPFSFSPRDPLPMEKFIRFGKIAV